MILEKGRISNGQAILLIVGFIMGTSIIILSGGQAKHDAWLAMSVGVAEAIMVALIFSFLSRRFPGKTLMEINDLVYGPYLGKLISLTFLWYLFHLASMVIGNIKDFMSVATMPNTPDLVFSFLIVMVCAYAVRGGIEVLARCSQILVPVSIGFLIFVLALNMKDFKIENLQPVLEAPIKDFLFASQGAACFPFAETVAFMMILPFTQKNKAIPRTVLTAITVGGIILILASIRNIGVLGASTGIYAYQNYENDRLINIGNLLTRMEIVTVIAALSMGFIKAAILLYGTVLGGAQVLGLRTYRPLIVPIAILMVILAELNFRTVSDNIIFAQQIYPLYAFPFQVGIPLTTLIVAFVRKLPREG